MSEESIGKGLPMRKETALARGWLALTAAYVFATLFLFHETAASIVAIWMRSQTFAHGFLVAPISLWLIWRQRHELAAIDPKPAPWVLVLTAGGVLLWLLARMVDIQIIQQLCLVGILITGVWTLLGTRIVYTIAFPLAFLFTAVPMGESLIVPLTNLTADTTEYLIRLSGVPLLREGNFLTLPTGKWSVVEACSGIRYLIASVTLGLVYAYLAYRVWWKRVIFVVAATVAPIVANSLRAYGVVMLGHLSNMKYGVGVDHLYYGWIFFGIVMLLLFWLGSFWEDGQAKQGGNEEHRQEPSVSPWSPSCLVTVLVMLVLVALGPLVSWSMLRASTSMDLAELQTPEAGVSWVASSHHDWNWLPHQPGADQVLENYYHRGTDTAGLFLYQYLTQQQGVELVAGAQPWTSGGEGWHLRQRDMVNITLDRGKRTLRVQEALISSGQRHLLIWSWYRVDGQYTSNPYLAKLYEARQQLLQGYRQGARYFLAVEIEDLYVNEPLLDPRAFLQDFLHDHQAAMESTLDSLTVQHDVR